MSNAVVMVDISDIFISEAFRKSPPRQEKIDKNIAYYKEHSTIDEPLKLLQDNRLVDGYARYVAAKECGAASLPCIILQPFRFIKGYHVQGEKIYTWKFKGMDIKEGDVVLVECMIQGRIKHKPITVTEVYDSHEEDIFKIRNVVRVLQKGIE